MLKKSQNSVLNQQKESQGPENKIVYKRQLFKKKKDEWKKLEKILERDEWALEMGSYLHLKAPSYFEEIKTLKSSRIWLDYNNRSLILQDLNLIHFPNLTQISLAHNHINSIEALTFLGAPFLEEIQLRENAISNISTLKKLTFLRVKTISLYHNYIKQISPLSRLQAPQLSILWLEYENQEKVQGQDLSSLCKTNTLKMRSLALGSAKRMGQKCFERRLQTKFLGLKTYRRL